MPIMAISQSISSIIILNALLSIAVFRVRTNNNITSVKNHNLPVYISIGFCYQSYWVTVNIFCSTLFIFILLTFADIFLAEFSYPRIFIYDRKYFNWNNQCYFFRCWCTVGWV